MKCNTFLVCFIGALLQYSAFASDCTPQISQKSSLIFVEGKPLPLVEAVINKVPLKMLLDTGASWSHLLHRFASENNLRVTELRRNASGVGGGVKLSITKVGSFQTLHQSLGATYFFVLTPGGFTPYFDGILGVEHILKQSVEINFREKYIGWFHEKDCALSNFERVSPSVIATNFILKSEHDIRPNFEVEVNGVLLRAILDTGASSSSMTKNAAVRANLTEQDVLIRDIKVRGIGGADRANKVKLRSLKINSVALELDSIHVDVNSKETDSSADLILGREIFMKFRVIFDVQSRRILFIPAELK